MNLDLDDLDSLLSGPSTNKAAAGAEQTSGVDWSVGMANPDDEESSDEEEDLMPQVDPSEDTGGTGDFALFQEADALQLVTASLGRIGTGTTESKSKAMGDERKSTQKMGVSMKDALAQLEYPTGQQQSLMPAEEVNRYPPSTFFSIQSFKPFSLTLTLTLTTQVEAVTWKHSSELPDDILEDFFTSEIAETFNAADDIWDFEVAPANQHVRAAPTVQKVEVAPQSVKAAVPQGDAAVTPPTAPVATVVATAGGVEEVRCGEVIHEGVHCDVCGAKPLKGPRFKCLNCADFDICLSCATTSNSHPPKHIFVEVRKSTPALRVIKARPCVAVDAQQARTGNHANITCVECKAYPIAGARYKCVVCDKYDVCKDCMHKRRNALDKCLPVTHNAGHAFVRIRMPWIRPHCTLWQYTPEVMRKAISEDCYQIIAEERIQKGLPPLQGGTSADYDPRPNPRPMNAGGAKKTTKKKNWGGDGKKKPKPQTGGKARAKAR